VKFMIPPSSTTHLFTQISTPDKKIILSAVSLSRTRLYSSNLQLPILIRAMGCERLDAVVKEIHGVVGEGRLLDSIEILFGDRGGEYAEEKECEAIRDPREGEVIECMTKRSQIGSCLELIFRGTASSEINERNRRIINKIT
jgi:hypothetical protein